MKKGINLIYEELTYKIRGILYNIHNKMNKYYKEIQYGDEIEKELKANNIRYIWIDKEMKNEIWSKEDEGLLLLFKNKEHFKKVYDEKGVQIWRII